MKRFIGLLERLQFSPFNRDLPSDLAEYMASESSDDIAWTLLLLSGSQLGELLPLRQLRQWVLAETQLPEWLYQECLERVQNPAECLSLLTDLIKPSAGTESSLALNEWIEVILPFRQWTAQNQLNQLKIWWSALSLAELTLVHQLLTGQFNARVSKRTIELALSKAYDDEGRKGLAARVLAIRTRLGESVPMTQLELWTCPKIPSS